MSPDAFTNAITTLALMGVIAALHVTGRELRKLKRTVAKLELYCEGLDALHRAHVEPPSEFRDSGVVIPGGARWPIIGGD